MTKQNIIFLDIDGPLMPGRQWFEPVNANLRKMYGTNWWREIDEHPEFKDQIKFDPVAVEWFNIWQKMGKAQVVLATNWVRWLEVEDILEICDRNGLHLDLHQNPITPRKLTSERMHEIGLWMDDNPGYNGVIVDDDASLLGYARWFNDPEMQAELSDDAWQRECKLVEVNYGDGLTLQNFTDANTWLGITPDQIGEEIFGVIPPTPEELEQRKKDLEMLVRCAI